MIEITRNLVDETVSDVSTILNRPWSSAWGDLSDVSIGFLSGTPLTYAEFNALTPEQRTQYVRTDLGNNNSNLLGTLAFNKMTILPAGNIVPGPQSLSFNYSGLDRVVKTRSGVCTWFFMYSGVVDIPIADVSHTFDNTYGLSIMGTVGAHGSGADIELLGGTTLTEGGEFSALDFSLDFKHTFT